MPIAPETLAEREPWVTINPPKETKEWVILVCYLGDARDKIMCVVEWTDTLWKRRGQEGPIFETVESGETDEQAAYRALAEELDLNDSSVVEAMENKWALSLVINPERENIIFRARVFLVQLRSGTQINTIIEEGDKEIIGREWKGVNSLNWNSRPGSNLAIQMVVWSYDRANPFPFVTVVNGVQTSES